jgi:hypothetical protein
MLVTGLVMIKSSRHDRSPRPETPNQHSFVGNRSRSSWSCLRVSVTLSDVLVSAWPEGALASATSGPTKASTYGSDLAQLDQAMAFDT